MEALAIVISNMTIIGLVVFILLEKQKTLMCKLEEVQNLHKKSVDITNSNRLDIKVVSDKLDKIASDNIAIKTRITLGK